MESYWIAIASGIISVATLMLSGISLRRKAAFDYVQSLERRLELAEEALARCQESEKALKVLVAQLEQQNANLMRMLIKEQNE